ncbi:MBL fold metallo-hydrolase [uncultured Vagococcus sp.]|uniref:MBL fold metallo-hydrolase n=1 Tax=uncultured Vagococcus sp. TaxID=189676 RepID=UPI0037DD8629
MLGPNQAFRHNAQKMGESLTELSAIIISHCHSDHTDGLPYLDLTQQPLYAGPHVTEPHYLKLLHYYKYVGVPKTIISHLDERITVVKEPL